MSATEEVKFRLTSEDNASKTNEKVGRSFSDMQKTIGLAGLEFSAIGAGMGAFVVKAIEGAGKAEQLQVAFSTMLGSGDKAKKLLADIGETAKTTPFELPELQEASKKLLAYGISAENVIPNLRMLGDVAAGVGTEKMPQLITAFGQIKAKGKLMGGELLQLTEAGFDLAGAMGVSREKLMQMMDSGKGVSFDDVSKAFEKVTGDGGRFHNMMENLSKTFLGRVSNIKDTIGQLMVAFGQSLMPTIDKILPMIENLTKWFAELSPETKSLIGETIAVGAGFAAIAGAVLLVIAAINPVTIAVAAVMAAFVLWRTKGDEIIAFFKGMGIDLPAIWNGIVATVQSSITNISTFFGLIVSVVQKYWPVFIEGFNNVIETVTPIWESFWKGISTIVDSVIKIISSIVKVGWDIWINLFNTAMAILSPIWESFWKALQPVLTTAWEVIKEIVSVAWDFIVTWFETAAALFSGDWDTFWKKINELTDLAWKLIKTVIEGALKLIGSLFEAAKTFVIDIWNKIWLALQNAWNEFSTNINKLISDAWEKIKQYFVDLSTDATATWNSFWDGLKTKVNEIVGWIQTQINNLLKSINNLLSSLGGLAGKVGGALGGAFGGGKAAGGRVMGGKSYLVGEEGPEIFSPPGSGKITPNNKIGGGGTIINNNFYGPISSKEFAVEILDEALREVKFSTALT